MSLRGFLFFKVFLDKCLLLLYNFILFYLFISKGTCILGVPQNIFDNDIFFNGYKSLRENPRCKNNTIEKPALFSLIPDLSGKSVLDLGCGFGENCAEFIEMDAKSVCGVDLSEKMLNEAKLRFGGRGIDFIRGDMNDLSGIRGNFDIVLSSLAVHYVKDFSKLAREVYAMVENGGYFIFSQEHPLNTAPEEDEVFTYDENNNARHYNLANYSVSGLRRVNWFVDGIEKYHRTFSDIINPLVAAGFQIEKMLEPIPCDDEIAVIIHCASIFTDRCFC